MTKSVPSSLGDGKPPPSGVLPDDPDFEDDDDIIAARKSKKSSAAQPVAAEAAATKSEPVADSIADSEPIADAEPIADSESEPIAADKPVADSEVVESRGIPGFEPAPDIEAEDPEDPDTETDDDIIAARKPAPKKISVNTTPVNALLLLLALVVGIVLGVWIAGQLRGDTPETTVPTATSSELSAEDIAARITELEQALAENPDDVAALLDLGVLLFNNGDLAGAAANWSHVIELEPDNENAWYFMAFYYIAQPDTEQALDALRKVIELAPGTEIAAQAQSHLDAWPTMTPSTSPGTEPS